MVREYNNSTAESIIAEWLHDDLDMAIMRLLMIHGKSYERIAEELGISDVTVKRRVSRCRPIIDRHMPGN